MLQDNNITYYQVGLLVNPSEYSSAPNPANGQIYQTTTNVQVSPGYGQYEFDEVAEDSYSDHVWPAKHPMAGQPITLRDYQVEIINRFLENPQCIQEIATGAGKTVMTAALSNAEIDFNKGALLSKDSPL